MAVKTENLAIIMTDIVGFTEATVHQSRSDIETLLDTHNRILLPIVRRYHGRHIKSIGDALLLVFRSPTDAMLCAMAMQDALYEYNRSRGKDKQIHIRVGSSLGEVRVTRNDVFGEPVNLTSRIAGVTPSDEIYLSEALFMAMNKAEVPSQEVGWKELKGIGQPVRVYNIPRFAVPRLVPDAMSTEDLSDLVYPFGGAHLSDEGDRFSVATHLRQWRRGIGAAIKGLGSAFGAFFARKSVRVALVIILASPVLVLGARFVNKRVAEYMAERKTEAAKVAVQAPPAPAPAPEPRIEKPPQVEAPAKPAASPEPVQAAPRPAPAPRPVAAQPVPQQPVVREAPVAKPEPVAAEPAARIFSSRKEVETAYKKKEIAESEYRRTLRVMEISRNREMEQAKQEYEKKKISKDEFKKRVKEIEARYE